MNPALESAFDGMDVPSPSVRARAGVAVYPRAIQGIRFPLSFPASEGRARRLVNVIIAAVALVVLSPLMLLIAAIVKLSSPGPVIYRQTRVGLDRRRSLNSGACSGRRLVDYGGKLFTIYKFRTMRPDPDARLQVWAQPNDSRITPIGRVLRRYRLDELPQLVNVVRGDMNVVGPRPEQPDIFLNLREQVDNYQLRQRVLPGITGWAQINQHYDCSIEDVRRKVKFDLEYIENLSVWQDLRILLHTLPVMLFRRGGW